MLKIQFRKNTKGTPPQQKRHGQYYNQDYHQDPTDMDFITDESGYVQYGNHEGYPERDTYQDTYDDNNSNNQETCLFCGDVIVGSHLAITTASGTHYIHPSCTVSGFALVINGVVLILNSLSSWFKKKDRR